MTILSLSPRDLNVTTLNETFSNAIESIVGVGITANYSLNIFTVETVLWGVFTILIIVSIWTFISRDMRPVSQRVLLAATLIMYGAATAHWALMYSRAANTSRALIHRQFTEGERLTTCINATMSGDSCDLFLFVEAPHAGELTSCGPTSLISLNMVLGDAIVVWRAWILWTRSRAVQAVSILFILGTLGTAIGDLTHACTDFTGSVFEGSPLGLAALTMSLITNLWATSLIGYKAWAHRRMIKMHLENRLSKTRVESLMVLLVESGVIYCSLWVILVAFNALVVQKGFDVTGPNTLPNTPTETFIRVVDTFLEGGLFQVIGIYPTLITVLVYAQKSHCSRLFTYDSESTTRVSSGTPGITHRLPYRDLRVQVHTETNVGDGRPLGTEVYGLNADSGIELKQKAPPFDLEV